MILRQFPPMGVYETLFSFAAATGKYMGDSGTHPWAQGYPLTTRLPGGPALPESIHIGHLDRKYPKATGEAPLLQAISDYYNRFYGAGITAENVAVFAGGRPAIFATLAFLLDDTTILLEGTEYTPYFDIVNVLKRDVKFVRSDANNRFRPGANDCSLALTGDETRVFLVKSNPCNPTGVAVSGDALGDLATAWSRPDRGALIDEAYEFFCDPAPQSILGHIDDIDQTNIIVIGAATKGLQVPGMRVGWAIAAREHIEIFRNYSSFGMGGVSRASQLYVTQLLKPERVARARDAVSTFYTQQRMRYSRGLTDLGLELFTGSGGFYHWARLPQGLSGDAFNERLFGYGAGILPGRLCDMTRVADQASRLDGFVRFSFGPLTADSYDEDMRILSQALS